MTDTLNDAPQVLANRYQVIRILGEGGFGTTFLASDTQLPSQRSCVVKQLKPSAENNQVNPLVLERFQREAAILESLGDGSDQIPSLYANFAEDNVYYLVEEWVEGDTLLQKIEKEGLMSESAVRKLLLSLLPVVDYIHQKKIVHRDIKPDNIISRWRDGKPVLIDFGAVKETMKAVVNSQELNSRSIVVGTPGFMPTEQIAGRPVYSSDLYSLGMTALYLLTGKLPQDLETDPETGRYLWQQWVPGLSTPFIDVLDKAIQIQQQERFANAQEMLTAIQATVASPSTESELAPSSQPVATAVSMPPEYAPTIARAVTPSIATQMDVSSVPAATSSGGEWKKAVITGGLIGASILGAAALISQQLPTVLQASKESNQPENQKGKQEKTATAVSTQKPISPKTQPEIPIIAAPQPEAPPQPAPASSAPTNATVVGETGSKYLRAGVGTQYGIVDTTYPGDRIQVLNGSHNRDGFLWYQVYLPKTGSQGWMASHLVDVDAQGGASLPPPTASAPAQSSTQLATRSTQPDVDAVIVGKSGSKNIRSGPGTNYPVKHTANPGDRVRIIGSSSDRGGYSWYKVYSPSSGTEGWIGAQLVEHLD
jgi:serine/threonine protein kinase, bacterial